MVLEEMDILDQLEFTWVDQLILRYGEVYYNKKIKRIDLFSLKHCLEYKKVNKTTKTKQTKKLEHQQQNMAGEMAQWL